MARFAFSGIAGDVANINAMTLELYGIADYWKTPGYTGASFKATVDSTGRWDFGAAGVDTTYQMQVSFPGSSLNGLIVNDTAATGTPTLQQWKKNSVVVAFVDYRGSILASGPSSGIGYSTGSGGSVTQLTSKATGVTLNRPNGRVITHNASLASAASVAFGVSNSTVAATDTVVAILQDAGGGAHSVLDYQVWAGNPSAGAFTVVVKNNTGGAIAEALTINFAVIKAVAA